MENITGVILAGGAARRMGGKDKGLLIFKRQPLFMHVVNRFAPQVSALLISANRHQDIYAQSGYPCIADTLNGFQGPLAGMLSGLAQSENEWVAFSSCDSPCIPLHFVRDLWLGKGNAAACWLRSSQRDHPVFCLLNRQLLPSLQAYLDSGERRVLQFLRQHGKSVSVEYPEQAFVNINTEQELKAFEEIR
ncbi:molybdenum cofactor guanylyltransferase MobA [Tatumella terrea]|uniref:Molybdenum cofactor guanylyltransferase n=1 Tax=Tatumella terrea TaxID=419007 RepID=A0ABW1VVF5_9GAMM